MMTAIIVDDEFHARQTLAMKVAEYCPEVSVLEQCESASDGVAAVRNLQPDLIFLDIEMPEGDGFSLVQVLGENAPLIIFVTAHRDYAISALRHGAFDYLLKPVKPIELQQTIARVRRIVNKAAVSDVTRIQLVDDDGFELMDVEQIVRCSASSNYTRIFGKDGRSRLASRTLGEFEELLVPRGFCRVHKSHLVNLCEVRRYQKGRGGRILMSDGEFVEVSARRRDQFLDELRQFVQS